jgi:hypothetical protein
LENCDKSGSVDLVDGKTIEGLAERFQVSIPLMTARLLEDFGKAKKIWY